MSDGATSAVGVALQCLGGERGDFSQSRQFQSTTEVRAAHSEWSMGNHACSWRLHMRHHVSRSGKGFAPSTRGWWSLLDAQFVQTQLLQWYIEKQCHGYTVSCYSKSSWMYLSHSCGKVFLQKVFLGAGKLWQYWTDQVAGRFQVLFSVRDFLVQPNLELPHH